MNPRLRPSQVNFEKKGNVQAGENDVVRPPIEPHIWFGIQRRMRLGKKHENYR